MGNQAYRFVLIGIGFVELLGPGCGKSPSAAKPKVEERALQPAERGRAVEARNRNRAQPMVPRDPARAPVTRSLPSGFGVNVYKYKLPNPMAPLLVKGPDDAKRLRCRRDNDCVLSYLEDGRCCASRCGLRVALNADYEARLRAHLAQHCARAGQGCPLVECSNRTSPGPVQHARCRKRRCVAVQEPAGTPAGGRQPRASARDIRTMIRPVSGGLRRCLTRAKMTTVVGLRIRLVGRTGKVDQVTLVGDRGAAAQGNTSLIRCLMGVLRQARVPPFGQPQMTVVYPISPKRPPR